MKEEKKHALLSASSSERWLNCIPSARIEETYKETESIFAKEGTKAHELCEAYILHRLGKIPNFIINVKNKEAPLEMQGYANEYANYVFDIENALTINVEEKIELDKYIPEGFGTVDCFVLTPNTLHIIDFKYGMGVKVSAYENSQLKIYALGIIEKYKMFYKIPDDITLHIYQPRISNISTFSIKTIDLLSWAEKVLKTTAFKAYKGIGEQKQGKWCKFCKHKNNCIARFNHFINFINKYK